MIFPINTPEFFISRYDFLAFLLVAYCENNSHTQIPVREGVNIIPQGFFDFSFNKIIFTNQKIKNILVGAKTHLRNIAQKFYRDRSSSFCLISVNAPRRSLTHLDAF